MTASDARPSFVDTNVFVYAVADDDPVRQAIALDLIERLAATEVLQTSTQVLQELYAVLTRKLQRKFTPRQALAYLDRIARSRVAGIDYGVVREAAELSARHTLSFWDALVIVAAASSGAERLYSEDLQHGRKILGMEIVNPFRKI
ncbi:MAG: PIN domain-containing protein [Acidobacteriota bacterium]